MSGKRVLKIIGGLLSISFALFFAAISYYETFYTPDPKAYRDLTVILYALPRVEYETRMPAKLFFTFKEYPGISFELLKCYFPSDYTTTLHPGDTVVIKILKEDYRREIRKEGNYFEQNASIEPTLYGFYKGDKNYVDIKKLAAFHLSEDQTTINIHYVIAFCFLFGGLVAAFSRD
jgi:hypothetical protein